MAFKNSLKLLASNFSVVWKHLVYVLITTLISVGLVLAFANPVIEVLRESGWIGTASGLIKTLYTEPIAIFDVVKELALTFFGVIYASFPSIWFSVIGLVLCGYFVPTFLAGIGFYNVTSVVQKQMTSLLCVGYTQNMISTLKSSTKYSLMKIAIKIPFDLVKLFLIVSFFRLSTSFFTNLIFLSLLTLGLILVSGLEITSIAAFAPCMVDIGGNPFRSFSKSIVPVFKKFMKTYSNAIVITLCSVLVNMLLGVFTVFSSLLVTIPASAVFVAIFGNVVYLSSNQKRYYLSKSIIVNPSNDENKLDTKHQTGV
ncbi:MAG: hypothetical protein IJW24_02725 [Clostridia bacterium]|nr:hypothetical protein [Clostridia bacterium]